MKKLLLPMEKVKKSNAICRARWFPENVYEPRIVSLLASQIQSTDEDFKEYEISVADLFANIYGGENYKTIKRTLESLISRTVTIQESNGNFTVYPLFTKGSYLTKENTIKIKINSDLKHHFLKLKEHYTQYNLMEFLTLSSTYSQRLFEFLKSWEDRESTLPIKVDELHQILGVPEDYKKNFAQFKRKALDPALKEINKKTSLEFSYEPIKFKNKVAQILFINSNPRKKYIEEEQKQIEFSSQQDTIKRHNEPVPVDFDKMAKRMREDNKRLVEEAKRNRNK